MQLGPSALRTCLSLVLLLSSSVTMLKADENLNQLSSDLGLQLESSKELDVNFGSLKIEPDRKVALSDVAKEPKVKSDSADETKLYTLAMVDPDAPKRSDPTAREWLHWLRVNIAGKDLRFNSASDSGDEVTPFKPSSPPAGSGWHRYAILVFEQPEGKIDAKSISKRNNFKIAKFAEDNNLGTKPFAANFYLTENAAFEDRKSKHGHRHGGDNDSSGGSIYRPQIWSAAALLLAATS